MKYLILLVLLATPAHGEKTEDECVKLHPEITSPVEMAECTSDAEAANLALKAAEDHLLNAIPDDPENAPRPAYYAAEAAWRFYRDEECNYESAGFSGTGASSLMIWCEADMAHARAEKLNKDAEAWLP